MAQSGRVRAVVLLLSTLLLGGFAPPEVKRASPAEEPPRTAQLTERIPRLFVDAVNDVIRGTIRPTRVRYQPPATLFLEDAVLLDPRGQTVARIESAEATVAITPLFAGNLVIRTLVLSRPSLELVEDEEGRLNLIEALSPKDPAKGDDEPPNVEIRLDDIRVDNGRFSFVNPDGVRVSARGIAGQGRIDVDLQKRSFILRARRLSATAGRVDTNEVGVPLSEMRVERVRVVDDRLEVTNARGKASGAEVSGGGNLSWAGEGRMNLRGRVEAPRDTWPERLERPPFTPPTVSADVTVRGSFAEPVVGAKGTFGPLKAFDYDIDSGSGEVLVTLESARIVSATLNAGSARATARGTVLFTPQTIDLEGQVSSLSLARALSPAALDEAPAGTVSGSYRARGSFTLEREPLLITSTAEVRRLSFAGVTPPSPLEVSSRVVVTRDEVRVESAQATGQGVRATLEGRVLVESERVDLRLDVKGDAPHRWIADLPPELQADSGTFNGTIKGPFDAVVVSGRVDVPVADAYGVPIRRATSTVQADARQVRLSGISASVAEGSASGQVLVRFGTRRGAPDLLSGQLRFTDVDLARVVLAEGELEATGKASAVATLSGTVAHPVIEVGGAVSDATLVGEPLGDVNARLLITRDLLRVQSLEVEGPLGLLASDGALTVELDELALGGALQVTLSDLSRVEAAKELGLAGSAVGTLRLGGSARSPELFAWFDADDISLREAPLGSGPAFARLYTREAGTKSASRVVELSARLSGPRGLLRARAAYDIDAEVANAELRLLEMDLEPWLEMAPEELPRAAGVVSGVVQVWGPIARLNARATLRLPEIVFLEREPVGGVDDENGRNGNGTTTERRQRALSRGEELRALRARGGIYFSGELIGGQVDALLCAFPGALARHSVGPCGGAERVWLRAHGTFEQASTAFDLDVLGYVDEAYLERFVPVLRELEAHVSLVATGRARLSRADEEAPVLVSGDISLLEARVELAEAPPGVLEEATRLRFDRNKVFFTEPLRFAVGDSRVTVAGYAGPDDVKLDIDGTVLLALAKLYSDEITQASGTAVAGLEIVVDEGVPKISGQIAPNPGASLTLRSLRERVDLLGGRVTFAPGRAEGVESAERVSIDNLRVAFGGGEASLDGGFTVALRTTDEGGLQLAGLTGFDLTARGEGISVQRGPIRLETSFTLGLEQRGATPVLTGQLEITDGLYRERFELLENFVLTRPSRPSVPLYQTLAPFGLDSLGLDVAVAVRDFRVRADLVTFPMDASLTGNLRLTNDVRVPALSGALEIVEGSLTFPTARFELIDSQIEFPQERASLEPRVGVMARADLTPSRTGCETDLPVLLSLEGDTLEEVQLDLEAETGERHSRSDLFVNVLFGQRLAQCEAARGLGDPRNAAVRAFTGQLFASGFTQQIEEVIATSIGGEIQFNIFLETGRLGTDVRWQLGRRVVFEGEAPLYTWESGAGTSAADREALNASNLRLRFLLFDHLPPGDGDLFLETELTSREDEIVGTSESNLEGRFKYRLFEY